MHIWHLMKVETCGITNLVSKRMSILPSFSDVNKYIDADTRDGYRSPLNRYGSFSVPPFRFRYRYGSFFGTYIEPILCFFQYQDFGTGTFHNQSANIGLNIDSFLFAK